MNALSELVKMSDDKLKNFNTRLVPECSYPILGVKVGDIRAIAKELVKNGEGEAFLEENHIYLEEYLLHGFIIEKTKDYGECLKMVNAVLPFLNNWMLTDTFSPKAFFNRAELIEEIKHWLDSSLPFTVRFGIVTLMRHFLDKQYFPEVLSLVADIKSDEYYVNMAQAWFFASSLCKQYDDSIAYIEERRLSDFTHNKTIQKSCESLRVSGEHKEYLRSLIIRNI